jgi:hypothetical protein
MQKRSGKMDLVMLNKFIDWLLAKDKDYIDW